MRTLACPDRRQTTAARHVAHGGRRAACRITYATNIIWMIPCATADGMMASSA